MTILGKILGKLIAKTVIKKIDRLNKDYENMSAKELAALSDEELDDAIDSRLFFNEDYNNVDKYNSVQLTAITIKSFDSEIQNGGLCQFFVNSSGNYAPYVIDSLENIGASETAKIFRRFIEINNINPKDLSSFISDSVDDYIEQYSSYPFDDFDDAYYENYEKENLDKLLVAYVRKNIDMI